MDFKTARAEARAIVAQMTAEEKMSQLLYHAPAIERLGIHEYNWWNEASHGVARAGTATVFPHAIALAATFNAELVQEVGDAVSTEARAKYNKNIQFGARDIYQGLTFWAPNINIFRDPRWGRGQETFGEDPYLTALLGVGYIKGLQGDGEYLKSAACAKHYAVHSGPESGRHTFDAEVSEKDLFETYLPAFEQSVKAGVAGVMGAYNRTNGEPCCASRRLIGDILLSQWGFGGYFVSDCGAIRDISENHHYAADLKEAAAVALKNGCNLNCGEAYAMLVEAYEEDLIDDADITEAVERLFTVRVMLGEFCDERPYSDIGFDRLDCAEHRELNLKAARESLVLLENKNSFLPIGKTDFKKIAVIGPNAMSRPVLEGNYNGFASEYITVADGMRRVFADADIIVAQGSPICYPTDDFGFGKIPSEGLAAASEAELTVLCLGLDRYIEGEENGIKDDFSEGGDKKTLYLPKVQMELAEQVCDLCENVIVVVMCGSANDLGERVRSKARAVIQGWYPGSLGGLAIAELIAGEFSPCGKLPLTFYREEDGLPDFCDYSMDGRTYRYLHKPPLYPFGYGLGYSEFRYEGISVTRADEKTVSVKVKLANVGSRTASDKVQVYARFSDSRTSTPNFQLCGCKSVKLAPGESTETELELDRYWLSAVLPDGSRVEPDGKILLYAGGHQPDLRSDELCGYSCVKVELK